ncbi:MAG: phytanoyl-CoA dioxygenase family protein [Planctomycetes bacterium]|nr:phytanoyl-CoA dioxygenase family protein [Planctomycetota bacterium]
MPDSTLKGQQVGLTDDQLRFYKTFGYVVLRGFFTPEEVQIIQREVSHAMTVQYAHKPFDGTARHWTMMLEEDTPFFASLMEDPRFLTIAKHLYGQDVLGVGTDANRYVGNTGWHRDTATVLQYGVKFAFYLDPVDALTGALRVVPSSHRYPDDEEFGKLIRGFAVQDVPAQALQSEPGDAVAFDLRTYHASFGGSRDRRMCTVVYYGNPRNAEEEESLRRQGEGNVRGSFKQFGCKRQYLYPRTWYQNPNRSPDRQWWIDRLKQIGYFDWPGVLQ